MKSHLLLAACMAFLGLAEPVAALAAPASGPAPASGSDTRQAARFSVTVEGSGPDVIMIPGMMSGRRVWDASVAAMGGKYRVHRLQLSGFAGEPASTGGDAILDPVVEELHAYITRNKLAKPAIVGHSMGGLIGMMLVSRYPEDARKLLVVDALPFFGLLYGPTATVEGARPQATAIRNHVITMPVDVFRKQQGETLATMAKAPETVAALLADSLASDRVTAGNALYEVMTTDLRPALPKIAVPTTVVYATNAFATESLIGPVYRSAYSAMPGAKLVAIDDTYHFIMFDQPARFNALLAGFLAGE